MSKKEYNLMRSFRLLLVLILIASPLASWANVNLTSLSFSKSKEGGAVRVHYDGKVKETPHFKAEQEGIHVFFPESSIKNKMKKDVAFLGAQKDTVIRLYPYQANVAKLKIDLPGNLGSKKEKVSLTIKDNYFEITFPKVESRVAPKTKAVVSRKTIKKKPKKEKESTVAPTSIDTLDENYLNKLVKDTKTKDKKEVKDKVSTIQSSSKKGIDLSSYILKVVAFLSLVVAFFYGVMTLLKKGVGRKTKLGFLNKADIMEVLATHHIAPKKSMLLVRVHEQVFLVSDTEKGLEFMTEVNNVNKLLKEGEKNLTGDNFDTNLDLQELTDQEDKVQIKKNIYVSNEETENNRKSRKNHFSQQIKEKVKNLKPLQQ
jgi:flagellar biogenesis protein FliO